MENFEFRNFSPNKNLKEKSERVLARIAESAPNDARITGVIEKLADRYSCSIEIGSATIPLSVVMSHRFAAISLDRAELSILRKLENWCQTKFIKLDNNPSRAPIRTAI